VAINVFEGGRRVSILLSVALILGFSVYTLKYYNEYPPYIPVTYVPTDSVEVPMLRVEECPPLSFTTPEIKMETKNGTVATVYLCRADSEYEEVIALAKEADRKGVREMQDRAVKRHAALYEHSPMETAQIKSVFVEDEKWVDDQWLPEILKSYLGPLVGFVSISLLFLWVFTWAVGWLVRGFMGIPRGQDNKNESDNLTA